MNILLNGHIIDQHKFGVTTVYQVEYENAIWYIAVEHNEVVYCMPDD